MAATHEPCGEGYIFFQGPTPKTGTQPDLPSFLEDLQQAQTRFAALNTEPVRMDPSPDTSLRNM